MLKSQDILIVLKLASIRLRAVRQARLIHQPAVFLNTLAGWEIDTLELAENEDAKSSEPTQAATEWTYASLSKQVGISASECNEAVKRCTRSGLLYTPRSKQRPEPLPKGLLEFLVHGLKYVFPAEEGPLARGIPTGFAAPVMADKLLSAGKHLQVWPDAYGKETGLTLIPIHKAVPFAVRRDIDLYGLLALVDAIRSGKLREEKMATEMLTKELSLL